jgi:hypothetical protein
VQTLRAALTRSCSMHRGAPPAAAGTLTDAKPPPPPHCPPPAVQPVSMRIADETRSWTAGRVNFLDDSFGAPPGFLHGESVS